MKIGVFLETEGSNGGIHQYGIMLMNSLQKYRNQISLIGICLTDDWVDYCVNAGIEYYFPKKNLYSEKPLQRYFHTYCVFMSRMVARENDYLDCVEHHIDVCIFTKPTPVAFLINPQIKSIVPIHDLMDIYEPRFREVGSFLERMTRRIVNYTIVKQCSGILADSSLGKKQIEEAFLSKRSSDSIYKLEYIPPDYIYEWKTAPVEQDWNIISKKIPKKYLFYPAQFWMHKNHLGLLKAVLYLNDCGEDISVVFCGAKKNAYEDIINFITENNMNEKVVILEYVSNYAMINLYKNATGLVMPTFFGPTNIPPLEAFLLECPVATSNIYAIPEEVGDAALLFDPNDFMDIARCIKELWNNSAKREELIKAGLDKSLELSRDKFAEKLYKIVLEVSNGQVC